MVQNLSQMLLLRFVCSAAADAAVVSNSAHCAVIKFETSRCASNEFYYFCTHITFKSHRLHPHHHRHAIILRLSAVFVVRVALHSRGCNCLVYTLIVSNAKFNIKIRVFFLSVLVFND